MQKKVGTLILTSLLEDLAAVEAPAARDPRKSPEAGAAASAGLLAGREPQGASNGAWGNLRLSAAEKMQKTKQTTWLANRRIFSFGPA